MKELDCQSLVIDAVRAHGGAAHKLSNRFLVGVSDLLVKLPDRPAALLEVKLSKFSDQMNGRVFKLDVTHLQKKFLEDYAAASMRCGILSFIEKGHKGVRGLHLALFRLDELRRTDYIVQVDRHKTAGGSETERHTNIVTILRELK